MLVADKDVGEWTLGEVKQSGYVHLMYCSSDGRLKAEGKIGQPSLHWSDHDWCRTCFNAGLNGRLNGRL